MAEEKQTPEAVTTTEPGPKTTRKKSATATASTGSTAKKAAATKSAKGGSTAKKAAGSKGTAAKKTAGTAKKSTAKKAASPVEALPDAADNELKNEVLQAPQDTEKTETGAKKATKKRKTAAKAAPQPAEEPPVAEEPVSRSEPLAVQPFEPIKLPTAPPSRAMVRAGGRELSDARPPLDFPERVKRNFFLRVALIIAVCVVLVASAVIYYVRPALYTEQTSSINFFYQSAEDQTLVVVNGEVCDTLQGMLQGASRNGRGDTCAAVVGEVLYLIRGKNVMEIAQKPLDFVLAADGTALAYRTEPGNLYYRETGKRDEPSLISKYCNSGAYALSSDGRELVYTAEDTTGVSYLRIESYSANRPFIENTAGLVPIAVSNKCRYIYYTDELGALYVFDSHNSQKVKCATAPDLTSLIFNRDFTEVLFTENGGTAFFAKGERCQIVGAASTEELQLLPNRRVASRTLVNGVQYLTKTFYANYFLHEVGTGKKLTYLDKKGNLTDVSFIDGAETVTVTDKGVYFLLTAVNGENVNRELHHVKPGKTDAARIEWGVTCYCTNVDGSRVMFTGYEDALYVYRAETGSVRICDSIMGQTLAVTADDLFCFYREEGVLTVSDNGGELRDLATNVVAFITPAHSLYYATEPQEDSTFTVYVSYHNQRVPEQVATGISKIE